MTNNEILNKWDWSDKSEILIAMDEFAKQQAIEFFKWNASKISSYLEYISKIQDFVRSKEIETALNTFEGATIEERYNLFLQSQQQK